MPSKESYESYRYPPPGHFCKGPADCDEAEEAELTEETLDELPAPAETLLLEEEPLLPGELPNDALAEVPADDTLPSSQ